MFICYKESDANGRRTPDSVLANDLYHQLTQEGFKVFFARITLEDKHGSAYEPYIFAALNSAKVMVVLGTRPEYLTAVWVKNECGCIPEIPGMKMHVLAEKGYSMEEILAMTSNTKDMEQLYKKYEIV